MSSPHYSKLAGNRRKLAEILQSRRFLMAITGLIILNAIVLGLETTPNLDPAVLHIYETIDLVILVVFSIELAAKFFAYRLGFFRSGWNWFDLIIVGIAWVPSSGSLAVLRAFRILRVLRLLSVVPQMRRVITALGLSIPGMTSVIGVLVLIFYVCAILATKLFGAHPDANMQEWFGSVGASAYTLFQVMTLESWSMGIVRPTMEIFPWSWIFFVPFIVLTSFAVLNLFIGIIVDAMQMAHNDTEEAEQQNKHDALTQQISQLQTELAEIKNLLKDQHTPPR
jgi:voltage-gated sodium channel